MLSLLLVSVVLSGCTKIKELEIVRDTKVFEPEIIGNTEVFEILNQRIEREENEGFTLVTIKGSAKNSGKNSLLHAEVRVKFYDTNGALMDTLITTTSNLNPSETWNFEIEYFETEESKIENYELIVGTILEAV